MKSALLVACVLACSMTMTEAACAQDVVVGREYDGDIDTLRYRAAHHMISEGRYSLRLYLDEEIRHDWRLKRDLALLWRREAEVLCNDSRPKGRLRPLSPVSSCEHVTVDGRRSGDCGTWIGIDGVVTCKRAASNESP